MRKVSRAEENYSELNLDNISTASDHEEKPVRVTRENLFDVVPHARGLVEGWEAQSGRPLEVVQVGDKDDEGFGTEHEVTEITPPHLRDLYDVD